MQIPCQADVVKNQFLSLLQYEQHILTPAGRTPSMGSWNIYQAVLVDGITSFDKVIERLGEKNIIRR
jgi:hypothetical protein